MNFRILAKFIMGLGALVMMYGGGKWAANQPEVFDRSKSEQTVFGRNDLGNMLNVQFSNAHHAQAREEARNVAIVGLVILFVGVALQAAAKRPREERGSYVPNAPAWTGAQAVGSPSQGLVRSDSGAEELRKCPLCAEWIKKAAVKCRFCQADVPPDPEEFRKQEAQAAAQAEGLAVAAARQRAMQEEAAELQAARDLAAAGSWDDVRARLTPLLAGSDAPPKETCLADYVLLASAEVKSGALDVALGVLRRIPEGLNGDAGAEAATTLTALARDAVMRRDTVTTRTVQAFARRLHAYGGQTASLLGGYLEVRSAEEALSFGDERAASTALDTAREFARTLAEENREARIVIEEEIATCEQGIRRTRQGRQRRLRLTIGLAILGVILVSAVGYLLSRREDTSVARRNSPRVAAPVPQPVVPGQGQERGVTVPAGAVGSGPNRVRPLARTVRVLTMPRLFDSNGRRMAEWKPLLDLVKNEGAVLTEYDGHSSLDSYDVFFWESCDPTKNQLLFPHVSDLLRQGKYVIVAASNSCFWDRNTFASDLANALLAKYGMRMNRDDPMENCEVTTVGSGPLVRGVPAFLDFRDAGIELLSPKRAEVEILAQDGRRPIMAAFFDKGGGTLLAYGGGDHLVYGAFNRATRATDYRVLGILRNLLRTYRSSHTEAVPDTAAPGVQAVLPSQPSEPPGVGTAEICGRARSPELGEPLTAALKLTRKKATRATDVEHFREAVTQAENATRIDPSCAEAWSLLAFARYRVAYDICGRGEYTSAEQAARQALELNPTVEVKSAVQRNLARIATARLNWDEGERLLNEANALTPGNHEVKSRLSELAIRKNPRPELLAAISKALAGQLLTEDDTRPIVADETPFLTNAVLARHGRRLNSAVPDWFFFCDGTPVQNHPAFDPNAGRDPVGKGTPDLDNVKFVQAFRKGLKSGVVEAE